jgi:cytochrome P450
MGSAPTDPVRAASHPDPYSYYADLVDNRPLYWDEALGLWVASSATAVRATLASESLLVRPPDAPVPPHLSGSPVGHLFADLVRMIDGPRHTRLRGSVSSAIESVAGDRVAKVASRMADSLGARTPRDGIGAWLSESACLLPLSVIGSLIGIPEDALERAAAWVGDFARAIGPAGNASAVDAASRAAAGLRELIEPLLATPDPARGEDLMRLDALSREANRDAAVANVIGMLVQTCDATAALIANCLVTLLRDPTTSAWAAAHPNGLPDFVAEVLRFESPVQNTRRYVGNEVEVAGHRLDRGDGVLVILAAANRDPVANPEPSRFLVNRPDRTLFSLGGGRHSCPGAGLATRIATAAVGSLIRSGRLPRRLTGPVTYRPSHNLRLPALDSLEFE